MILDIRSEAHDLSNECYICEYACVNDVVNHKSLKLFKKAVAYHCSYLPSI